MQKDLFDRPESRQQPQETMREILSQLRKSGKADPVDVARAEFFMDRPETDDDALVSAVFWLSLAGRSGHSSVDLIELHEDPRHVLADELVDPAELPPVYPGWADRIRKNPAGGGETDTGTPLVLSGSRLYFRKMFDYEQQIIKKLKKAAEKEAAFSGDTDEIKKKLETWFEPGKQTLWQRAACLNALTGKLTVITGGPGTGKTYTVLRLMALLLETGQKTDHRIALAAPTGKAAARVRESILAGLEQLDVSPEIRSHIPLEAKTIHRLLGSMRHSGRFRHNRENPLPYSVVIVDEASMIDLPLMARLTDALRDDARLILLGDKDQLASVEAGSVFADICGPKSMNRVSPSFAETAKACGIRIPAECIEKNIPPMGTAIIRLTHSRRFDEGSGVGKLASLINKGDADGVMELLKNPEQSDVSWKDSDFWEDLTRSLQEQLTIYRSEVSDAEKMNAMKRIQVLCAHRRGPLGTEWMNREIERRLGIRRSDNPWYAGRPVIMTRNDYQLGLYNGDVGLCTTVKREGENEEFRVLMEQFDDKENKVVIRGRRPALLTDMETCWAQSVHKSQGSEYETAVVVFPSKKSPVITRELLYTAVTRVTGNVIITGPEAVIRHAVMHPTRRSGGLRKKLWS